MVLIESNQFEQDVENYIVLLTQLSPDVFSKDLLNESNLLQRATNFLKTCEKIKCRKFIGPHDIVEVNMDVDLRYNISQGNSRLNTAFVAFLFTVFNKLVKEEEQAPVTPPPDVVVPDATDQIEYCEKEIER